MDQKTTFTHTDGRVFTLVGTTEHVTRDKRQVTLKVWECCCEHPGCGIPVISKTATDTPWLWHNFHPARFCGAHRIAARKEGQARMIKARADGLARWRASPEGKAAIAQKAQDSMGAVEKLIYTTVLALSLADGDVQWPVLCRAVYDALDPPEQGKRDTRRQRIHRAFFSLEMKNRLKHRGGVVTVLR